MNNENPICGDCAFFTQDHSANLDPDFPLQRILYNIKLRETAASGGSADEKRVVYGKCNAVFTGEKGIEESYDMGVLSSLSCIAIDDEGETLFQLKSSTS